MALSLQLTVIPPAGDSYDIAFDTNIVRSQIVEGGRSGRGAVVQLEAGMMPRATDGFADENALLERAPIMRALRPDGEPVWLDVNEQHRLPKCVTGDELTGTNAADLDTGGQIRASQLI
jgi:hypothetical protein